MIKRMIISLCVIFVTHLANGQISKVETPKLYIAIIADGRGDSILVRWALSNTAAWQIGNRYGYKLERFTVLRDGKPTNELLTKPTLVIDTIKPLPKDKWDDVIQLDERAAIVQSGIYPETEENTNNKKNSLEDLMQSQQQLDMKMGFSLFACDINPLFAKSAGLMFVDKKVKSNERYVYKISIANPSKGKSIFPGSTAIGTSQKQVLPKLKIEKIQWGNQIASINWDTKFDKGIYSAYYLEKSENGKDFKAVTELPILTASEKVNLTKSAYQDSLQNNETTYYYRIKGLTPFGEIGPTSEYVSGHGIGAYEVIPIITSGKGDNIKRVATITWNFPEEHKKEVVGYQILRANNGDGPYSEINPKVLAGTDTIFTDTKPQTSNYYKVKALGLDGQIAISFPFLINVYDADPPAIPTGIKATVNDSGIVILKWKQNKDKDLYGYRVFRANSLKEEFVDIRQDFVFQNSITDTITLNTLTKEVYYKVVAVDQNYNNSKFSDPYLLKRPDIIAPTKPLLMNYKMIKNGLSLEWSPSGSEDVIKYVLQRIDKKTYDAKEILTWNPLKTTPSKTIIDSTAKLGNTYYYQLLAFDEAGNSSFGRTGEIEYETGYRKPISDFKGIVNLKDRLVTLVWSYPSEFEVERFIIYRCKKGEPMEIYTTLLGTKNYLEEKNLPIGNYYQYQIKGEIKGGLRTEISKVVEVKY